MADEKVNASPEESKIPEAPAPSGPGDPPAPEHTEGPAVPGGDQAAPAHAEPATPEQSVIPLFIFDLIVTIPFLLSNWFFNIIMP